ncbi:Protein FAM150B [Willisornis vidua]|uniref:Protein FAM150B n=1 Tax=Willisornis vidua TaxID=1566151 RepID=A0ABQ9D5J5_9PASS|nr:Protein FAM150B [Willisornis vidua]
MSGLRSPGLLGLVLLMLSAGYCKEKTDSADLKDKQSLLNLIMEIIQELKRYHLEKEDGMQYFSKHDYNLDRREVADYGGYQDEQRVGPLYFSPKCSKHFHRLYHNTRDCTIPAYVITMTRNTKNQEKCLGNQQGNRTYYLLANSIVNKRFIFAD